MTILTSYADFLTRLDEQGFMPLSRFLPGVPSLSEQTQDNQWHTGLDTDPWQWKDRAAEEKRAAYGCILGGHKGFVSARLYPYFYAACRPTAPMPDRWEAGEVTQTVWQLWNLFEERGCLPGGLNTADVRSALGVTAKSGGSRVDAALNQLQREYYLTTAGVRQKVAKDGSLYGWPAVVYERAADWAPAEWITPQIPREAAWEKIFEAARAMGEGVDVKALAKKLGRYGGV